MTDPQLDAVGSGEIEDPIPAMLAAFSAKAQLALVEVKAIQTDIDQLLAMPDSGVVTVELDDRGGITSVSLDQAERSKLGAEGLNYEINAGVARAQRDAATAAIPNADQYARREDDYDVESMSADQLIAAAFAGSDLDPDWAPAPVRTVWNSTRRIGVTIDGAGVRSVDFDPEWLDSAPVAIISQELVAASMHAFAEIDQEQRED